MITTSLSFLSKRNIVASPDLILSFSPGTYPIRRYLSPSCSRRRRSFRCLPPLFASDFCAAATTVVSTSTSSSRLISLRSRLVSTSPLSSELLLLPSSSRALLRSQKSCRFRFAQTRSFHNRFRSTRSEPISHFYPANHSSRKYITAATSAFIILLCTYSIAESPSIDPSNPKFIAAVKDFSNFYSFFRWWASTPDTASAPIPAPPSSGRDTPRNPNPRNPNDTIYIQEIMTTAIQPGRPETITPEQEVKLKAFWNATLSLFGQSSTQLEAPKPAPTDESTLADEISNVKIDQPEPPGTADSETKTKSKRKYFGLSASKKDKKDKKDEKDKDKLAPPASTVTGTPSPPPGLTADPEDKYNQGKDFKAALASQTPEQLRTTFWGFVKYDNPDALLLRFLRARKWDVDKALVMMVSTMHWRGQEVFVEDIVHEGELGALMHTRDELDLDAKKHCEGFLHQLRVGKSYIHGTDKDNRPVCIVSVRLHKAHEQTPESLERYTIYLIETTRLLLKHPTDTAAILFDMTGFGMSNMDYAPVKFMIKCFEAHYPECLGICLVHNAPWIFQGIWKIIKGWLDPVVASKVHFTTKVSDLAEFIPLSHIPKSLGGEEDWTYEYKEPIEGENPSIDSPTPEDLAEKSKLEDERKKIIEEYEKNTRDWIKEDSKGSSEHTDVKDERSGLRERLKGNYWGLDRFYRAKTYYDRIGMVGKNGDVDFYPSGKKVVEEKGKVNGASSTVPAPAPVGAADVPKHSSDDDVD
ncbi:hypothetical protein TWF694_000874 [Orbilia ellipsospora]|uniref:CRAL-TRIO domain-containing protein n=1 Tax=Orbilia ellipsospora TaxID=2528407 RepID=A0AAV9XRF6_9PEZI